MQSDMGVNFGLLRLSYHLSPNPSGSFGFGATCGTVTSLSTAGYSGGCGQFDTLQHDGVRLRPPLWPS